MSDRRRHLRTVTANAHAALEDLVGALSDLERYKRYVTGQHCFRASIEPVVRTTWHLWPQGQLPQMLEADLANDLCELGCAPVLSLPTADMVKSREDLMGVSYVLEGSSLGARVLIGDARKLGLSDRHGARHLAIQCAASDSWRRFIQQLETAEPLDMARLSGAAAATFELARLAFCRVDNADVV